MISATHRLRKRLRPAVLILVCLVIALSLFIGDRQTKETFAQAPIHYTLIIDPGHGGIDGGAAAIDGSRESDINLAIALKLRAIAVFYGLDSKMTRQDDRSLSSADSYSEHSDLVERLRICGEYSEPVLI